MSQTTSHVHCPLRPGRPSLHTLDVNRIKILLLFDRGDSRDMAMDVRCKHSQSLLSADRHTILCCVKSPGLYEHKCKTPFCSCASLPSSCIVLAIRKGTDKPLGSRRRRENSSQRERGPSTCGGPRFTRPRGWGPQKGRLPDFRQKQTTSYLWIQHSKTSGCWESSDGCWTHASWH